MTMKRMYAGGPWIRPPAIQTAHMRHGDKVRTIKITIEFQVPDGRMAFTEAEVTLEALTDQNYLRFCIDQGIEKFMQLNKLG